METTDKSKSDAPDEEQSKAPRWPAVLGVISIVVFTWAGIEVFFLQARPVATLEHEALVSADGAPVLGRRGRRGLYGPGVVVLAQ